MVLCALAVLLQLVAAAVDPEPASARRADTAEERLAIDIFKRNTPSVVNVTNLALRHGLMCCSCASQGQLWSVEACGT